LTRWFNINLGLYNQAGVTPESIVKVPSPPGVLKALRICVINAGAQAVANTITVRLNGAATALTITQNDNVAIGTVTTVADSVVVAAGDLIDIEIVGNALSTGNYSWSVA
jgi:hypothetical protein